jgi:hypothetical protein
MMSLNRKGAKVAKGCRGFLVAGYGEISSNEENQQCQKNGKGTLQVGKSLSNRRL